MPTNYRSSVPQRYQNDAQFRMLVDTLYMHMDHADFSPTEIREAAMLAHILFEERRIRPMLIDDASFIIRRSASPDPPYVQYNTLVRCVDCGWSGGDSQLKAQTCPLCDGRVAEEGSPEYEKAKRS